MEKHDDKELDCTSMVNSSADDSRISANNGPEIHSHELSEDGSSSCPAGKRESPKRTDRRIPSYLRASTGSCHDLCKHGRRNHHSEEAKPWKTPRQKAAETVVSDARKKEKVVKKKAHNVSAVEKSPSLEPPEIIKKEITAEKTYDEDQSLELPSNSVHSKCGNNVEGSSSSSADNSDGMIVKGRRNPRAKTDRAVKLASRANRKEALATPSRKAGKINKRNNEVAPFESSISQGEKMKLAVYESKRPSTINHKGNDSTNVAKIYAIKENRPSAKLRFRSGTVVNRPQENIAPTRLKFRRAKPIDHHDKSVSDRNEGNVQRLKESCVKPQRKKMAVDSEEKSPPCVNTCKSRKVADPPSDFSLAKRLRFGKVRVAGIEGDDRGDSKTKTFRTTGGKCDIAAGEEMSGKKMFNFKHRNVQAKKDAQILFNNVIEETASKLVESRKSKVKALVGAFETVISLQEGKPSSHGAA